MIHSSLWPFLSVLVVALGMGLALLATHLLLFGRPDQTTAHRRRRHVAAYGLLAFALALPFLAFWIKPDSDTEATAPDSTRFNVLDEILPLVLALATTVLIVLVLYWFFSGRLRREPDGMEVPQRHPSRLTRQVTMLALTLVLVFEVILLYPKDDASDLLIKVIGLAITAVVALASTSFVSNAMAGLMLRAVRNFRPGDYISVDNQFGVVMERGLFHTSIQTDSSDFAALPNLYLATHPVKVIRPHRGTQVTATLSLGYEISRKTIEAVLSEAATKAGLSDPHVLVLELGNYAVTYRVFGTWKRPEDEGPVREGLLDVRSRLRGCILDALHTRRIEIMSPTYINQRVLPADQKIVPPVRSSVPQGDPAAPSSADATIFTESLREGDLLETRARIQKLREQRATASPTQQAEIDKELSHLESQEAELAAQKKEFEQDDADATASDPLSL